MTAVEFGDDRTGDRGPEAPVQSSLAGGEHQGGAVHLRPPLRRGHGGDRPRALDGDRPVLQGGPDWGLPVREGLGTAAGAQALRRAAAPCRQLPHRDRCGAIGLPVGLATAIYLSEYAGGRTRTIVKPVLEILAGIPTVVYGYFALTFVTPLLRGVFPTTGVFNAASASIVVGIMILPDGGLAVRRRAAGGPGIAAPGRLCARGDPVRGVGACGRARGAVGDRGLVRARPLPRHRRDDGGDHRGRRDAEADG